MPKKISHYILMAIGMLFSFLISSSLLQSLFIENSPTPFWHTLDEKVVELKQNALLAQTSVVDYIQSVSSSISSTHYTQPPTTQNEVSFSAFDLSPAPTYAITDVPIPTSYKAPTVIPTSAMLPTSPPIHTIAPRPSPTTQPTSKPTRAPSPTNTPKPTASISFPKVQGDPLKQTWYGNGSLACYTTERFIQVYANGLTPNSCYKNIQSAVDSNIVSTTLLGRSIQVHKKALPAFEAVAKTLDQYKVDSSTYKFPSKTYKIKNVGAYVFRCNVNASTSGKNDVCSEGCKLSPHAFGIGVDINYDENCNGCKNYDMPKEISDTFEVYGFRWGGHYPLIGSYIDPMHFEYMKDLCDGI
ncbi:MAG: M15 family metallopeptidase [Candidatus Roizmanbacteria bacterium]|nr:M15 family metallopeptidase [Candidatus Roizmanbacteria bacterium]